jgi:excisionase family DNA binding protein
MQVRPYELTTTARCISAEEAATYLGISRRTFERAVEGGELPRGIRLGKRRVVWDRRALDAHLDRLGMSDQPPAEQGAEPRRHRRRP